MKKTPLIIGGTVLTLTLIGGGIFAFQALGNRSEIEVIPVSYVSTSWWEITMNQVDISHLIWCKK